MKSLISILVINSLVTISVWAQELDTLWTRYQGYGIIHTALPNAGNGYVLAGRTSNWTVAKFDSVGVLQDSILFGGEVVSLCIADASSVVAVIQSGALFKTDFETVQWTNADFENSFLIPPVITCTLDGNFMMVGVCAFDCGLLITKLNNQGDTLWTRESDFWGPVSINSIQPTVDSGCVIAGSIGFWDTDMFNAFVVKLSSSGEEQWQHQYSPSSYQTFGDGIETTENGYILMGRWIEDWTTNWFTMRLGILGDSLAFNSYSISGSQYPCKFTKAADNGFAIIGTVGRIDAAESFAVIKTDSIGTMVWRRFAPFYFEYEVAYYANNIVKLSDGNFLLLYQTEPPGWEANTIAAKVPFSGNLSIYDDLIYSPSTFSLSAYPNPFNPTMNLNLSIAQATQVKLKIYNINGREVQTLFEGRLEVGEHKFNFDGANFPSGLYFASLQNGQDIQMKKLLLLR